MQVWSRLTHLTALHAKNIVTSSSLQGLISALPQLRNLSIFQLQIAVDAGQLLCTMPPLPRHSALTSLSHSILSTEVIAPTQTP
jgi:hypothetical protein